MVEGSLFMVEGSGFGLFCLGFRDEGVGLKPVVKCC